MLPMSIKMMKYEHDRWTYAPKKHNGMQDAKNVEKIGLKNVPMLMTNTYYLLPMGMGGRIKPDVNGPSWKKIKHK